MASLNAVFSNSTFNKAVRYKRVRPSKYRKGMDIEIIAYRDGRYTIKFGEEPAHEVLPGSSEFNEFFVGFLDWVGVP